MEKTNLFSGTQLLHYSNRMSEQSTPTKYTQSAIDEFLTDGDGAIILGDVDFIDDFSFDPSEPINDSEEDLEVILADLFERGQNHPKWIKFGKQFKSFPAYNVRISHFLAYVDGKVGKVDIKLEELMLHFNDYVEEQHDRTKVNSLNLITLQP